MIATNPEFRLRFGGEYPGFEKIVESFSELERREWQRICIPYPRGGRENPFDPDSNGRYFCHTDYYFSCAGDDPADFAEGNQRSGYWNCPIPLGHQNLLVNERLAVVGSGRVLRRWPALRNQEQLLRVPELTGTVFSVSTMWYPRPQEDKYRPVRFWPDHVDNRPTLDDAIELALKQQGCLPFLVTRQLINTHWL